MTVTIDGQAVQTFPVSMGRPDSTAVDGKTVSFVTPSGAYVAQEKCDVKQMTSASYGLPNDAALGYDSQIPLAVRISLARLFVYGTGIGLNAFTGRQARPAPPPRLVRPSLQPEAPLRLPHNGFGVSNRWSATIDRKPERHVRSSLVAMVSTMPRPATP